MNFIKNWWTDDTCRQLFAVTYNDVVIADDIGSLLISIGSAVLQQSSPVHITNTYTERDRQTNHAK